MYISSYRANRRKQKKDRRWKSGNKKEGLLFAFKRFFKLTLVILSIVPVIYAIDRTYGFLKNAVTLPSWKVEDINISNTFYIKKEKVLAYFKGLEGKSIFQIDLEGIVKKLKANPWVKEAYVRRDPSGTLFIHITERTPAALLHHEGKEYLVDEEGIILSLADRDMPGLPRIYGLDKEHLRPGEKIRGSGFYSSMELNKELLHDRWIDRSSLWIEIEKGRNITLHLKGYRIRLGKNHFHKKLRRFRMVLEDLRKRGIKYKEIDLRFKDQVIVRTAKT